MFYSLSPGENLLGDVNWHSSSMWLGNKQDILDVVCAILKV